MFSHFKDLAESNALETIAFPMLGAATTRLELVEVAQNLMKSIVSEMKRDERPCRKVFIVAWLVSHRHAISAVAEDLDLKEI